MEIKFDFYIIKPIQLPWEFVSPTELGGLEYHLSPELSVQINGMVTGDTTFHVGEQMIFMDQQEVTGFQIEEVFLNEIMPNKSQERIIKAFREGRSSCFFTSRQMAFFQQLFTERNFMSNEVSVYYKGIKVKDVTQLPIKEYKMIIAAFEELDVKWCLDEISKEQVNEKVEQSIKDNAGRLGDSVRQNTKEKLKNKQFLKRLAVGMGAVVVGIGGLIGRKKLSEGKGAWTVVAAVLVGVTGVIMELFGRQELQSCMRILNTD
jgi:hypothetical protein